MWHQCQDEFGSYYKNAATGELSSTNPTSMTPASPILLPSAKTSDITLLSCVHGRDRRAQRNIGKRDLQAAVKYGFKEEGWGGRWKYTFGNIVYITDATSRAEITSYVLPFALTPVLVTPSDEATQDKLAAFFAANPDKCTSHTVLVVDQSGSMKKADVWEYRTRSQAVYATLALDLIGKQIDSGQLRWTDVATLIEMNDTATVVFERQPITNVLYNRIARRQTEATPRFGGMYLPALDAAENALAKDLGNGLCALMLLFLSDGGPSETVYLSQGGTDERNRSIGARVYALASRFRKQLTVATIGFAREGEDFEVLRTMADQATAAGATGVFSFSQLCGSTLSDAITSLGSRLSATRTHLTAMGSRANATLRTVASEKQQPMCPQGSADVINVSGSGCQAGWDVYEDGAGCTVRRAVWNDVSRAWEYGPLVEPSACGVAIRQCKFGEGAERVVYQLREVQQTPGRFGALQTVGRRLVGKESRFIEDDEFVKLKFHQIFCETQLKAGQLAVKFNAAVRAALQAARQPAAALAEISFLECSVYVVDGERDFGVLAEKELDQSRYTKWNSNNGFVQGEGAADVNDLAALMHAVHLGPRFDGGNMALAEIMEGSEEDESDSEDGDTIHELPRIPAPRTSAAHRAHNVGLAAATSPSTSVAISVEDFPQAFSHFTYRDTARKMLVCDLQGVLDSRRQPPLFELTDPVIHYKSSRTRRKFGRTDHGVKGIHSFFRSHKCNALCRLLGLPNDADGGRPPQRRGW